MSSTSTSHSKPSAAHATASTSATLFATLDAVKAQNEIAKFQFRASNTWVAGTHSRSTIYGFYGAGRRWSTCTRPRSTPTTLRSSSAPTTRRPRWSTCCTPSPPA